MPVLHGQSNKSAKEALDSSTDSYTVHWHGSQLRWFPSASSWCYPKCTVASQPKFTFDFSAFSRLQPFQFFLKPLFCWISIWFAKSGTIHVNSMFWAVSAVFSGSENCIRQHSFGVMPVSLPVGFHWRLQHSALIKHVPSQIFNPKKAVYPAHLHIGSNLDFSILFAADNWPDL